MELNNFFSLDSPIKNKQKLIIKKVRPSENFKAKRDQDTVWRLSQTKKIYEDVEAIDNLIISNPHFNWSKDLTLIGLALNCSTKDEWYKNPKTNKARNKVHVNS